MQCAPLVLGVLGLQVLPTPQRETLTTKAGVLDPLEGYLLPKLKA